MRASERTATHTQLGQVLPPPRGVQAGRYAVCLGRAVRGDASVALALEACTHSLTWSSLSSTCSLRAGRKTNTGGVLPSPGSRGGRPQASQRGAKPEERLPPEVVGTSTASNMARQVVLVSPATAWSRLRVPPTQARGGHRVDAFGEGASVDTSPRDGRCVCQHSVSVIFKQLWPAPRYLEGIACQSRLGSGERGV